MTLIIVSEFCIDLIAAVFISFSPELLISPPVNNQKLATGASPPETNLSISLPLPPLLLPSPPLPPPASTSPASAAEAFLNIPYFPLFIVYKQLALSW